MRPLFYYIVFALAALGAQAQSLYLYDVNTSAFPKIRANYVAVDAIDKAYINLTALDFGVSEQAGNGLPVDLTATVTHGCRVLARDSAASILLIVDESLSMEDIVGSTRRIDLVKQSLVTFVSALNFTTGTQVCIIGFSGNSRIACPWSASKTVLIDSINRLAPKGATNYESPFIGIPNIFEEFKKRPSSIPKTAIFITDDQPNPPIPNPAVLVDTVVRKANEQGIVIHSISVDETSTNPTLALICSLTGGTSHAGTELELNSFFELISFSFTSRSVCYIEWISPFGCSSYDRERTAIVTLKKGNSAFDTVSYTTSISSIAVVTSSTPLLEVGNPVAGGSVFASVTFTPVNHDMLVRGFTISPSTHFTVVDWDFPRGSINPPSPSNVLTFQKNVARTVRIKLTEGLTPVVHTAVLTLIADPCNVVQLLRGGGRQVVVITPNGGEVLTTCDTADIEWTGVPGPAPVKIEWSIDGVKWNTISNNATGFLYRWLPPKKGQTYRLRITYAPTTEYSWLAQIGNTGIDTASSIAVTPSGEKAYATGWFSGTTQFAAGPVVFPQGSKDGFMQEFDGDGAWLKTFVLTGEAGKNEKIIGAVTDDKGNVYIAGSFESTTASLVNGGASSSLRMPTGQTGSVRDISDMFVARISAAGNVDWIRYGQGSFRYSAEVTASSIGITKNSKGQSEIVVGGTFINFISTGPTKTGQQKQLGPAASLGAYYALYDEYGNAVDLQAKTPPTTYQFASKTTRDSSGCTYEVDHFTQTVYKGSFYATARSASTDVFVARRCGGLPSVDESNSVFSVTTPSLSMADTILVMRPTTVSLTSTNTFTQRICNTSNEAIQILDATISGPNAPEFTLSVPINGRFVQPNECIDIDIVFVPTTEGKRTATLTLTGSCGILAAPTLTGDGVSGCNLFVIGKVQMSNVIVGSISSTQPCIIRNTTAAPITVSVSIQPAGTRFDISEKGPIELQPNQCFAPTITFDATAVSPGDYTATLAYVLPAECGVLSSELLATVTDTNVIIPKDTAFSLNNVDWFARRLGTVNDSVMKLSNDGKQDLFIESVSIGASNGNITADLSTLPPTPFLLRSSQSITIPIHFAPTTRSLHTMEVVAVARGVKDAVKGLARGTGVLPAIVASGDSWPATAVLSVAAKTGYVTIRNSDASWPLVIDNVVFVRPTQSDFRWAVPSATLFPATIQPNGTLQIPVQFVPQAGGVRSEFVRIYHDAKMGPSPIPPYADTTVELIGIAQTTDALNPLVFAPTLTCDEVTASFWVKNPSATVPFVVDAIDETDANNGFELLTTTPIVIAGGDSVEVFVRFSPSVKQLYAATYFIRNISIPGMYINVSGEGVTTDLVAQFPPLPDAPAGSLVNITITLHPSAPFYSGLSRVTVEMLYPQLSLNYAGRETTSPAVSVVSVDNAVSGRLFYTLDVALPFVQDVRITPVFRTLLSSDTTAEVTANLATEYRCVVTKSAIDEFVISMTCAGGSRVVSLAPHGFGLMQPYPSPASDDVTIRYSTGYNTSATFDVIDAIGNVVQSVQLGEQPSAEYEIDLHVQTLAAGTYVLRMTSGHYIDSRVFSVVR